MLTDCRDIRGRRVRSLCKTRALCVTRKGIVGKRSKMYSIVNGTVGRSLRVQFYDHIWSPNHKPGSVFRQTIEPGKYLKLRQVFEPNNHSLLKRLTAVIVFIPKQYSRCTNNWRSMYYSFVLYSYREIMHKQTELNIVTPTCYRREYRYNNQINYFYALLTYNTPIRYKIVSLDKTVCNVCYCVINLQI